MQRHKRCKKTESCCAEVHPAKLLSEFHVAQCLRPDDILNFMRLDGTRRSRSQDINHVAPEDLASSDVARGPQATALDDGSIFLIICNKFVGRAKRAFEDARLFDHLRPVVGIHRKFMIGTYAVVAVG